MDIWAGLNYNAGMVTKQSAKKASVKTKKAPVAKTTKVVSARSTPKKRAPAGVSQKVDFYPNRMTVAVSALAGSILVLVTLIAVIGSR